MEKIRIGIYSVSFAPTKTGKDKWVIESNNGKFSVWDRKLAEELNSKLNENVEVDVRPPQEGTNYLPTITNIRGINAGGLSVAPNPTLQGVHSVDMLKEVQQGARSINGQEQQSVDIEHMSGRPTEKFRTPAEMVATELTVAVIGQSISGAINVNTAVNMYKEALELLG